MPTLKMTIIMSKRPESARFVDLAVALGKYPTYRVYDACGARHTKEQSYAALYGNNKGW